ncbi:MAG: hypothetical protein PUG67_09210 [Peptoniphilaceae bacterium]|nr:hypothetical protein [Peptoniphilaceae bacterium]MDY6018499.1 hypothetical protein [Anaerococcus sp.]
MDIKEKDFHILLSHFYNYYFVEYLEELLADEKDKYSTITLLKGIDYFFRLCKENHVDIPFSDFKSYLEQNYIDWTEIYAYLMDRYKKELCDFGKETKLSFKYI